jgi:tRNA(Ile)-lysidine synthase
VVDEAAARLSRDAGPVVFSSEYADLPAEIALRLLGRAITQVGNERLVELAKLEALYEALAVAMASGPRAARFRRTLAGALVTFDGQITVERAPARRIGAPAGTKPRKGAFTEGW